MVTRWNPVERLSTYLGSRYGALLVSLLALLAAYAFAGSYPRARWLLDVLGGFLLISLLRAVAGGRIAQRIVLGLGIPAIGVSALARSGGIEALYPVALSLRVAFFGTVLVRLFADVLKRRRINMDAVLGACCVYLLLGIGWSGIYSLIEWAAPGSFNLPVAARAGASTGWIELELVYFSLITMTTVGYGDITPASDPARIVAAVEALLAQLYLAIIIARLVGMELVHREREPSP